MHPLPYFASAAVLAPLLWVLGERALQLNATLRAVVARHPGTHWVPLPPMQGSGATLLARDGFHPGPQAYPLWAQALAAAIVQGQAS